jgi:hypothetical protein
MYGLSENFSRKNFKGNGRSEPELDPKGRKDSEMSSCGLTQVAVHFIFPSILCFTIR